MSWSGWHSGGVALIALACTGTQVVNSVLDSAQMESWCTARFLFIGGKHEVVNGAGG